MYHSNYPTDFSELIVPLLCCFLHLSFVLVSLCLDKRSVCDVIFTRSEVKTHGCEVSQLVGIGYLGVRMVLLTIQADLYTNNFWRTSLQEILNSYAIPAFERLLKQQIGRYHLLRIKFKLSLVLSIKESWLSGLGNGHERTQLGSSDSIESLH